MAEYIENVVNQTSKLDWAMPFQRTGQFPLDRSSVFSSLADATLYASGEANDERKLGGTSYVGQVIAVLDDGEVTVYAIAADRTLAEVGKVPVGDNRTVVVAEDGTISIKGASGAEGKSYQLVSDANGNVTWAEVDSGSVPALDARLQAAEGEIDTLQTDVADLKAAVGDAETGLVKEVADVKADLADNYYDKTEVDGLVAGAFHFKGVADNLEEDGDLIVNGEVLTGMKPGDVYQVGDKEYAWSGSAWVELGFNVDLSNYATKANVSTAKDEAVAAAASDATSKADAALAAAKTHIDEAIAGLGIGDYAKTTDVESAIAAAKTAMEAYADAAETDAVATAGTNADNKIATKVGEIGDVTVKSYVDSKETALNSAINAQKDRIDNLGALAALSEVGEGNLSTDLAAKINNKADKATTLAGYGIGDAYTKTEIDDKLSATNGTVASNAAKLEGVSGTVVDAIATAKSEAIADAKTETSTQVNALANGAVATNAQGVATNAAAIEAIKNADTGILAQANKHTNDAIAALSAEGGAIKANADAIAALTNGQVATNKNDIDTLNTKVGTLETTVSTGLADRYTKSETDEAIATAIADADHLKRQIVTELPTLPDENVIYMIKDESVAGADKYQEYMLIGTELVLIGDTSVDLSGYAEKSTVEALSAKVNDIEANAEVNIIEIVKANGVALEVNATDRSVNIPAATAAALGLVKVDDDTIGSTDGVIGVKRLGVSKLYIEEGTELILDGGKA